MKRHSAMYRHLTHHAIVGPLSNPIVVRFVEEQVSIGFLILKSIIEAW